MKTETLNQTVATAKTINKTAFVGIREYVNSKGEISNYIIIAGFSYEKALLHDFNTLKEQKNNVINFLSKQYNKELVIEAYKNVYLSLEKRLSSEEIKEALRNNNDKTIKQSDAQLDAYDVLAKGVKQHKETKQIIIHGLVVRKKVIQAIEYKETKSRELTIVQNKIKKLCEFKQDKVRNFIFENGTIKMQGLTL